MRVKLLLFFLSFPFVTSVYALNLQGRLGVGFTNQLITGEPALSFKLQRNYSFAIGGLLGVNSEEDETSYAAGLKLYKIIYDEPQLTFYLSGMAAFFTYLFEDESHNGHQFDGSFGSEFHFQGLESIGFSFEFGLGASRFEDKNRFGTIGNSFIKSAVHFYL